MKYKAKVNGLFDFEFTEGEIDCLDIVPISEDKSHSIRVMKTARRMGLKTVAVFSTVDRDAPHVKFADEAVFIGPPPSSESYLLGDKIVKIAKRLNVDGIHPGYGFLSENADFAKAVEAKGIAFIGPKPKAINHERQIGSKRSR